MCVCSSLAVGSHRVLSLLVYFMHQTLSLLFFLFLLPSVYSYSLQSYFSLQCDRRSTPPIVLLAHWCITSLISRYVTTSQVNQVGSCGGTLSTYLHRLTDSHIFEHIFTQTLVLSEYLVMGGEAIRTRK